MQGGCICCRCGSSARRCAHARTQRGDGGIQESQRRRRRRRRLDQNGLRGGIRPTVSLSTVKYWRLTRPNLSFHIKHVVSCPPR
eukprot:3595807-Pleurochrysis_carterae.AAC.2